MSRSFPYDHGLYWVHGKDIGVWSIAMVDTGKEKIHLYEESFRYDVTIAYSEESIAESFGGPTEWYGPFACPGGDFGENTIVLDQEMNIEAEEKKAAMVAVHVDFRHCRDEGHGSNLTITRICSREEAGKYITREVDDEVRQGEGGKP